MAILAGDIRLVASQVMDDVDEGGGAPTSTIIADSTSNSIFNDISELDRAGGRVNLRKVFPSVQTDNRDTYLGANVILADPPNDPRVSITMFRSSDTFDRRTDAADRIEAYLNKSNVWDGYLLENHIAGQRAIQIFHRTSAVPPVPGKTLCLVMNEGLVNEYFQYVRVTSVSTETRTYTALVGTGIIDYEASVSTCDLSDALNADFPGSPASRFYTALNNKTVLRDTLVADAARYVGASLLTDEVTTGDLTANVASIFSKIVPSAQSETALVDLPLTGTRLPMVATAPGLLSHTVSLTVGPNATLYLPTGCYPGTLTFTMGAVTVTDNGVGRLLYNANDVGAIDYATGGLSFSASAPSVGGGGTVEYRPATAVSMQGYTVKRAVTAANRGYVWVVPTVPVAAPNSLTVSYRAQGNWYEIRDDGNGVIKGSDPAYGVGTVSYVTGSVSVTLGALPDVDSDIIFTWGTPQEFVFLGTSALQIQAPRINFDLGQPVKPGSLLLGWPTGRTATDNGSGLITGDATGEIYYGSGKGFIRPTVLPGSGDFTVDYEAGGGEIYGVATPGGTVWSGTIPNAPIAPKSVVIEFQIFQEASNPGPLTGQVAESSQTVTAIVTDNGSGGLVLQGHGPLPGSSINYATGAVVMPVNLVATFPVAQYEWVGIRGNYS